MRLPLVLLVTAAAFLCAGCPKKTPEAPATPDSATADTSQALTPGDSGTPDEAGNDSGTRVQGGTAAAQEACVDRWLQEHHLDRYGHPEGTMYAGGTPLFNEATGESQDRLEHVFARQPDARKACP